MIGELSNLKSLNLSRLVLDDMSFIKSLSLTSLDIRYTKIKDYSDIKYLEKLEFLMMVNCNVTNIDFLENKQELKTLILDDNNISDISIIGTLSNLEGLTISNNCIEDMSPLLDCISLRRIDLCNNKINHAIPLEGLEHIDLKGNPIVSQ